MKNYTVTYKTLGLSVKTVVIAADSYSVAANGAAHFYRYEQADGRLRGEVGELIASITNPVTITIEGDEGVTEPTWDPGKSAFPPGTFGVTTYALPLSFDELTLLRQGLKELDPGKQAGVDSRLDARLYAAQARLRAGRRSGIDVEGLPPMSESVSRDTMLNEMVACGLTFGAALSLYKDWYVRGVLSPPARRIVIRYVNNKGVTDKRAYLTSMDPGKPEICIDLRPYTAPNWKDATRD